ncbi:uncharacterized protein [Ptychodera flava]|uniref:uncharacterized protein isoform X2 n=1 Tax=Ptychodera flava TaxID=63121 RepID=UPI003969D5EF
MCKLKHSPLPSVIRDPQTSYFKRRRVPVNHGNVHEDAIIMKQKRISNTWKRCFINLTLPFYITVTDLSVENQKPMPYKAIELVEKCANLQNSKRIKKKHLKFKFISNDPKQNMQVQCRDIDQYLDLTSSISCMIDLYKFIDVQNLKSKQRMASTASVKAEPSIASFETDSSFDDYVDDDEGPNQPSFIMDTISPSDISNKLADDDHKKDMARSLSKSLSMISLSSISSFTLSYFSCLEEIHDSDMATASASDSEGSAFNLDCSLLASSALSPEDDITNVQVTDTVL